MEDPHAPFNETPTPITPFDAPGTAEAQRVKVRKLLLFALGFLGWFVVNFGIWKLILWLNPGPGIFINFAILPANLLLMIVLALARQTRMIAFGIVAAMAANLVISLLIGQMLAGFCFLPFFLD